MKWIKVWRCERKVIQHENTEKMSEMMSDIRERFIIDMICIRSCEHKVIQHEKKEKLMMIEE